MENFNHPEKVAGENEKEIDYKYINNQIVNKDLIHSDKEENQINNENVIYSEIEDKFPKTELREVEQYFFTEEVIKNLIDSLEYEENIVCLGTPAVADGFYKFKQKIVTCLDIDSRFNYLPGFQFFDILNSPDEINFKTDLLIIDPPFFKMSLVELYNCVEKLTGGNKSTKITFAFVHREERALLNIFKSYNLQLTKFQLEYRTVEPNRWNNYALYSNFEMGKIKFFNKKKISSISNINKNKKK